MQNKLANIAILIVIIILPLAAIEIYFNIQSLANILVGFLVAGIIVAWLGLVCSFFDL